MQTWTNNARASATLLPIEPWEIAASQIALLCKGGELALMRKTIGTERMLGLARSFGAV
jgi:hypothetical protein